MEPLGDTVFFRPSDVTDIDRIYELEKSSYPQDEMASYDKLKFRLENAPGLFLVALKPGAEGSSDTLVGYICSTLSDKEELTEESMSNHVPGGGLVCIHSVCVESSERRKGIATRMLQAYRPFVQAHIPQATAFRLICKEPMVPLYEKAGFAVLGPSGVAHGSDPWIDMEMRLE